MHAVYVPDGNRICPTHLINNRLAGGVELTRHYTRSDTVLSASASSEMVMDLRARLFKSVSAPFIDFDNSLIPCEFYQRWTGWTREQFNSMFDVVSSHLYDTHNRQARNAFGMFWIFLKTGNSFDTVASFFNLHVTNGCQIVSRAIHKVAELLDTHFASNHVGFSHAVREEIQAHSTPYADTFFGKDQVKTIWDGTYLYTQKSGFYSLGRRTYSMHKHRHLVKFMSVVAPDGYCLATLGPYFSDGRNNDAHMTESIFKKQEVIKIEIEKIDIERIE
eukprot:Lithocolla_globosa_v1_NODE_4336_length_1460_cov_4.435587.p1 type:complete len:276 gc:universal NODE_4336_length_1460_cov_4.435587:590-1417(+)